MEMRAKEDIPKSEDINPPLLPLAYSLYSSFLPSHCSSCFSPLGPGPGPTTSFFHYCSKCSTSSSSSSSSAEHHLLTLLHTHPSLFPYPDSSHLRLALRLLHLLPSHSLSHSPRLLGLLTNYQHEHGLGHFKAGAKAIAMALALTNGRQIDIDDDCAYELEEAVLCLVVTNAVEIVLHGHRIGVAVYDKCFSWINHSCTPNSCFRFLSAFSEAALYASPHSLRIFPCGHDNVELKCEDDCTTCELAKGVSNYGPRLIVRSIKDIRRGEEVTITYTDLLQPTALRQSELLLEYKFLCNCERCSAIPQAYVDHALQELFCVHLYESCSKILDQHELEVAFEKFRDMLDGTIADYMDTDDPVSCCEKVEKILSEGLIDQNLQQTNKASIHVKLSPLHSLSIKAYTTLVSTYKIRARLRTEEMQLQSMDMNRTSVAYSVLLAGATHHLFLSEPSLIASAATFWIDAGQLLLEFGLSSTWNLFAKAELQSISAFRDANCPKCLLMFKIRWAVSSSQIQNTIFYDISAEFLKCVSTITPKIWNFLNQGCIHLNNVRDPINFSWIQACRTPNNTQSQYDEFQSCHGKDNVDLIKCVSGNESIDLRKDILQLGMHCSLYGSYLSSICHGDYFSSITPKYDSCLKSPFEAV